ncbi:crossover junction endonuclease MUS81 [Episyrphus balteatus]|uniref:crossover junction endonuclease MUS81 n=1 Tax=Episyrphus balteatus TaxID=286459 RepID=UPI002485475E|nr:crossover junction endonuclease MUS81 [Episyrphus balteatus]
MDNQQCIEITLKNPNPIFEKWIERWLEEAIKKNYKSQHRMREALQSLRQFPLPLATGRDCAILRGFGQKLCDLIDQELQQQRETDPASILNTTASTYSNDIKTVVKSVQKSKKESKKRELTEKQKAKQLELEEAQEQIIASPGTFRILLLVDIQETNGKTKKTFDKTRDYIEKLQIPHEVRRLTIGDFTWICRDERGRELVLPYIVERKRMDDFASSIRDGRFHEQKFRLKSSKIQNLIYLIENYGNNEHVGLPVPTLLQSAVNTQVHGDFQIKYTNNHWESILYLKAMTSSLIRHYKDKLLISTAKEDIQCCTPHDSTIGLLKFKDFYDDSSRNSGLTIRDIFIKQLLQLRTLSMERAIAIVNKYPTPKALLLAYDACATKEEGQLLLAALPCGQLSRPLGVSISTIIYDFYTSYFE